MPSLAALAFTSAAAIDSSSRFFIGFDGFGGHKFQGKLDDVRVYNRALTDAEVSALYELEKP